MVDVISYNEYLKKILSQTLDSYNTLRRIQDKPGDLDNINKEMLKINGFIKVVTNNIDQKKIPLNDFKILQSKFSQYLENYFFEKEIETMAPLYSNDIHRVKNMRLKIIEALEDKKMIECIKDLIEKLWLVVKNAYYVDVQIIGYLVAQDIFQRNVDAMRMIVNFKK